MQFVFTHQEPLTDVLISSVLSDLRVALSIRKVKQTLYYKIQWVAIECLQNMGKHNPMNYNILPFQFTVMQQSENYRISTTHAVSTAQAVELKSSLDNIKLLTKEQLTALYKQQVENPISSSHSGAGLGLLLMARKANQNFTYQLTPIDKTHYRYEIAFCLR